MDVDFIQLSCWFTDIDFVCQTATKNCSNVKNAEMKQFKTILTC